MPGRVGRGLPVLIAVSLLALALGTVHSFSVFLEPLEMRFGAGRGPVSLTYSLALVSLTLAVLAGHRLFGILQPARLVLAVGAVAAAGLGLTAWAPSLPVVWLGYSLLFGAANGAGYGFGLQLAAQANPGREGLAMGAVTAAYALGAVISPAPLAWALGRGGIGAAMLGLALALLAVAPIAAGMITRTGACLRIAPAGGGAPLARGALALLWTGYGAGVAAGLMAIGHAAGIARSMGLEGGPWLAPMVIALCNMGGSVSGGWMCDRIAPARLLTGLPLASAAALLVLAVTGSAGLVLICLGAIGFAYGALIAVYPAVIAKRFGPADSTRAYGRVFTAWGAAGLAAPWLAGALYDRNGDYGAALAVAAGLGLASAIVAAADDRANSDRIEPMSRP